jgi:hypothetical protein
LWFGGARRVMEVVIYRKLEAPKELKTNKGLLKATASGFLV